MSKRDRQGVRTPAGLEQKYSFGTFFSEQKKANARQDDALDQTNLTMREFISLAASAIESLQKDMTAANKSIQSLVDKDKALEESDSSIQSQIAKYWETIYPVGHIYLSLSETSPATLFGGTWEKIEDRFLLAAGSTYAAGSTGGEATHTLTIEEMPSHNHTLYGYAHNGVNNEGNIYGIPYKTGGADYAWESYNPDSALPWGIENTGGSKPHNNMPPYLAVRVWQRTA